MAEIGLIAACMKHIFVYGAHKHAQDEITHQNVLFVAHYLNRSE